MEFLSGGGFGWCGVAGVAGLEQQADQKPELCMCARLHSERIATTGRKFLFSWGEDFSSPCLDRLLLRFSKRHKEKFTNFADPSPITSNHQIIP